MKRRWWRPSIWTNRRRRSSSIAEHTTTLVEASPREIVIIDASVDDIDQLLDDLHASDRNIEVFVLDAERDGIDQITEILDGTDRY